MLKIGEEERNWIRASIDNFPRGAKSWGSSWWGRVRSRSFSPLSGRNYSRFVQFGERSNKEGETDDSGEERDAKAVSLSRREGDKI